TPYAGILAIPFSTSLLVEMKTDTALVGGKVLT
ncbi:unnamed protein product, partial [marine sediment metagenome]